MKNEYPNYREKGITRDKLEKQLKLSKKEKKMIEDFMDFCSVKAKRDKIQDKRTNILQVRDVMEISLDKLTKKDLIKFSGILNSSDRTNWTKDGIKMDFKKFIRYHYPDWSKRFGDLNGILPGERQETNPDKINSTVISQILENIPKYLYGLSGSHRDEAVFVCTYETGGRPHEIKQLKFKDLELDKEPPRVTLHTSKGNKKGTRCIVIDKSKAYLQRWKKEYPFEFSADAYVFPSKKSRDKPITSVAFNDIFKKAAKKSGLPHLYPYLIRHARLTEINKKGMAGIKAALYGGHSLRTSQLYCHLNEDDLHKEVITKLYNEKELGKSEEPWFETNSLQKEMEWIKKERDESRQKLAELKLDVDELKQFKTNWDYIFEKMKKDPLRFFLSQDGELCEKAIIYINGKEISLLKNPEINVTEALSHLKSSSKR